MSRTKEENRANVARYRARQRERRENVKTLSLFMLGTEIFEEIRINVEPTAYGTLKVKYEVPDQAAMLLRDYCDEIGFDLDDILGDAIEEAIALCTRRREQIASPQLATVR